MGSIPISPRSPEITGNPHSQYGIHSVKMEKGVNFFNKPITCISGSEEGERVRIVT